MCKYVYIYICAGLADNLNLRDKTWLLLEDPVIFPVKIPAVFELEVLAKTTDFIGKKSGRDCVQGIGVNQETCGFKAARMRKWTTRGYQQADDGLYSNQTL